MEKKTIKGKKRANISTFIQKNENENFQCINKSNVKQTKVSKNSLHRVK